MAGLSGLNFVDGAMRGAQFVAGMQDRQQRAGLMQAQEQRAQESHGMQMENAQQQQEINAIRVKDLNEEHAAKMNRALAWSMHSLKDAPEETKKFLSLHPNLDASRIMSPEYGQAIDTLKGAAEGKIDYRHPQVAAAFDILNPEIGLGATQGRKVSTSRIYPGKTPGTVVVGLKVDGDPEERALTERRSTDPDDPVKEIKLEDLFGRIQVAEKYRGFLADPDNQKWFIQQTIGPDLAKKNMESQKMGLEMQKLRNDAADSVPTTFGELQTDPETGQRYQKDSKGKITWAPSPRVGAGGQATQRQKDYDFAVSKLGMDQEAALEWSSSDKTPTERAEAYANRMVQAETVGGNFPEGYKPNDAWKAHREAFMNEYGNFGKGGKQPKAEAAPKPSGQLRKAPQAAIDELRKNPSMKDKFQEFYGYLPDGM